MLGVFLLFDNLGFFLPIVHSIVISWQALLIAIGAIFLFDGKTDHKNAGIALVFIGMLFLLPKIFDVSVKGVAVPILIIAGGVYLVIRASTRRVHPSFFNRKQFENFDKMPFTETSIDSNGVIHREYVFTGSKEKWTYGKVKNVEIEAVFSGVELDFTQAELSDEVETIYIKVSSVFSGVTLYVPQEWNVMFQKTGVFGGFVDKRPRSIALFAKGKIVVMELEAVFGGGEIKCYE
jgi:predicted membrane protein